ncbi:hypothetical protein [Promicromonospora kroppenstedtii]|uniref:hypothetical protein n=1 Tax=Promicromonospora kroppenstedtii TaxID=440482 RepID=UPI0004BC95A9|nr:hypothetical protein [Promicromonospora kroppenstedtii]
MRAKYTIGHRVYEPGAEDAHGNPVDAWAAPVDLSVYGIAPTASLADVEPVAGRMAVMTLMTVFVPAGAALGPHDRYVVDGEEWEQEGEAGDYTRNPFKGPSFAGIILNLKRVEG